MTMDHKAYKLDYDGFQRELAPILSKALETGEAKELRTFVERNFAHLKDPNEGGPLGPNWHELVEPPLPNRPDLELQLWGDLALTKYYDPSQDFGLSTEWQEAEEHLQVAGVDPTPIVLGQPLQADGRYFDPGLQGAYFQSPRDVRYALASLDCSAFQECAPLREWLELLRSAAAAGAGLYVTF